MSKTGIPRFPWKDDLDMTMGLKIHRMMRDQKKDPETLRTEAQERREVSDTILDIIYSKLVERKKGDPKPGDLDEK